MPDERATPALGIRREGRLCSRLLAPEGTLWLTVRGKTPEGWPFETRIRVPSAGADAYRIGATCQATLELCEP